ncbi:MAG: UbiA family prenyltransferase [Methanomicrobiales archaeon]|nr:UbiA family prenyltransferase [Methanomicrobiales archaeon]
MATTYLSFSIQQIPCSAVGLAIPFLATFSVYNLNRKTDGDEDAINCQDRYAFTRRYEHILFGSALAAIAIAMILAGLSGVPVMVLTASPFLFGILYSVRWLPPVSRYRRLKEIPVVKNLVVGLSWSVPASLLPVYLSGAGPTVRTALVCTLFFLWGFIASTAPDIRDRAGDAHAGMKTIPVLIGEHRTLRLLLWINLIAGSLIIVAGLAFFPLLITGLLAAVILYSQTCLFILGRPSLRDFACDVLIDGQYLLIGCALLALTLLHVAPGSLAVG